MILAVKHIDENKKIVEFMSAKGEKLAAHITNNNINSIKNSSGKSLLHTRMKEIYGKSRAEFMQEVIIYELQV